MTFLIFIQPTMVVVRDRSHAVLGFRPENCCPEIVVWTLVSGKLFRLTVKIAQGTTNRLIYVGVDVPCLCGWVRRIIHEKHISWHYIEHSDAATSSKGSLWCTFPFSPILLHFVQPRLNSVTTSFSHSRFGAIRFGLSIYAFRNKSIYCEAVSENMDN